MSERRSKYHAQRAEVDGVKFDSQAEATRYRELRLLERAGEITGLEVHPRFELQPAFTAHGKRERAIEYEADFSYWAGGVRHVEDVKGMRLPVYLVKRKLFLYRYQSIEFIEVGA